MSRRILCEKCGVRENKPMHPEDVMNGFHRRRVEIRAKKPAVLQIKTYQGKSTSDMKLVETENPASLMCDDCGNPIKDGDQAVAVTMWRGDVEPPAWEQDYCQ